MKKQGVRLLPRGVCEEVVSFGRKVESGKREEVQGPPSGLEFANNSFK